jgi:hypothetical protein
MRSSGNSILDELKRLKTVHATSKINSKVFQPTEPEQRELIVGNAVKKLVSLTVKREGMKYVFHQKMKIEEELRRIADGQSAGGDGNESVHSEHTDATSSIHGGNTSHSQQLADNKKGGNGSRTKSSQSRKRNAKNNHNNNNNRSISPAQVGSSTMIRSDIITSRMSQSLSKQNNNKDGRTTSFMTTLSSNPSTDDIIREIHTQASEQLRDAKSIFESVCKSFEGGKVCQFHPKRHFEELDVSQFATNTMSIANVTKLEDLNQMKKKDGILLLFDPSTDTQLHVATIKVSYMKSLDLNNEIEVSKEYSFWSNGNYYGLKLMREFVKNPRQSNRGGYMQTQTQTQTLSGTSLGMNLNRGESSSSFAGDNNGDDSAMSPIGMLSKMNSHMSAMGDANQGLMDQPSWLEQDNAIIETFEPDEIDERAPNANLQAALQFGGTEKCSLPGWHGRSALFIPATKCRLQVVNLMGLSKKAAVANNLSRLRMYGICCPNPKVGIKKVLEFLEYHVLQDAANITLPGGLTALNIAAFHGNFEVRSFSIINLYVWYSYFYFFSSCLLGCAAIGIKWF